MQKFKEGQLVRVIRPFWTDGTASGFRGTFGVIEDSRDPDGDYGIRSAGDDDRFGYVGEDNLEAVEETKPKVGTATVTVELRFMLGDKDITDAIKGLVNA